MNDEEEFMQEIVESDHKPVYQKPKTSLFLLKADEIQSGAAQVLESQGAGYLTS
jgi:hypothetical protein